MGDTDARGLAHGYGAMVALDRHACDPDCSHAKGTPHWDGRSLLWWYEGYWNHGTRNGDGLKVDAKALVAMDGQWRDDRFDGRGTRVYGRGLWVLSPDGSGRGRWSGGDLWRHDGEWRDGERHGRASCMSLAPPAARSSAHGSVAFSRWVATL